MIQRVLKKYGIWLLTVIFLLGAYYYPLPYFISKPGEAVELAPIIAVENGHSEKGTFMLTTVRMGGANIFNYGLAKWDSYRDIIPKETLLAHYKDLEEYSQRQLQVMESSQDLAILVAYRLAGKPVEVQNEGLLITSIVAGMPAEKHLKFGDIITKVDDKTLSSLEELIEHIQNKKIGDKVTITYLRADDEQEVQLSLAYLPLTEEEEEKEAKPRVGIGISATTKRTLGNVDPPVKINTSRIGGPSAGLMFTLELYNQLTAEDITKGYRIAGTGTINEEGMVGRIGGIHQKIVAAHKAEAEYFFAPHEEGATNSNYQVAVATAKDIKSNMVIIPVDTVQNALNYLKKLPKKNE